MRTLAIIAIATMLAGCSSESDRFRKSSNETAKSYASFVVEKTDMTDISAARRRHRRRHRAEPAKVTEPADQVTKMIKTVSIPVNLEPDPDNPLLITYWPALETPPVDDPEPVAIEVPVVAKATQRASIEPWMVIGVVMAVMTAISGAIWWWPWTKVPSGGRSLPSRMPL